MLHKLYRYGTWNLQGKSLEKLGDWLQLHHDSYDMLALQEVGGSVSPSKEDGSLQQIEFEPEISEMQDCFVFGTSSVEAHLGIVILVEMHGVQKVLKTCHGRRFAAMLVLRDDGREVLYVSVHLPHNDYPGSQFQLACDELHMLFHKYAQVSIVVGGDFNCEWDMPGDNRGGTLQAELCAYGVASRFPPGATWEGRRSKKTYDYFLFNRIAQSEWVDRDFGDETVIVQGAEQEMCSDHALVAYNVLVKCKSASSTQTPSRFRMCKRWSVSSGAVHESARCKRDVFFKDDLRAQWETLGQMSKEVSIPKRACKYKDPVHIKLMCKQRAAWTRAWTAKG